MSYQAVQWALHDSPMLLTEKGKPDTTARFVLVELAEHAHDDGTSTFPSPLHIRWATGLDERTIDRALRRLESAGLIASDGTTRDGVKRWKLAMEVTRPESDWMELQAEREATKRLESDRRQARRKRALSGTQNPGQGTLDSPEATDVRHAESGCPARKMPESGTQNPDVRHGVPP